MEQNRRDFLKGTLWMGAVAAMAGGCKTTAGLAPVGNMTLFKAPALRKVRVGVVGLGMRGPGAVHRLSSIPGVEVVALCDLYKSRVQSQIEALKKRGKPEPKGYWVYESDSDVKRDETEAYRRMCDSDIDLVYATSPWQTHAPIALCAMRHGKHAAVEVPSAMTLDECWELVETSENTGRHCMQLENCCYGEAEMLALNMARQGLFGEIMHAEGAYIHDLRELNYLDPKKGGYQGYWRLRWNAAHTGNPYATHGLVPLMQTMGINRGDRFDYLTCVATNQVGMDEYARIKFGEDSWEYKLHPKCADMSTTVLRTVNGKTVMIQHDVTSPRPYSRINLISGTRGMLSGIERKYDLRIALAAKPGDGAHGYSNEAETEKLAEQYRHPLWKEAGELAKKMGGHGGMDFLMDLRLCYCLQNGLPLDMNVYDLAASCSLAELCERSATNRGASQDVPDFTRGAWKTLAPLGIETVDVNKLGITDVERDERQLNV